jgi:hypothetical protein
MLLFDGVLIGTEMEVGKQGFNDAVMFAKTTCCFVDDLDKITHTHTHTHPDCNFHVYLCTDILLIVEEREKKGQRRDCLHHVVALAYSVVIPVAGKPAFQILQPRVDFKYLFRAANNEAKALWMTKITDAILEIRARLHIGSTPKASK